MTKEIISIIVNYLEKLSKIKTLLFILYILIKIKFNLTFSLVCIVFLIVISTNFIQYKLNKTMYDNQTKINKNNFFESIFIFFWILTANYLFSKLGNCAWLTSNFNDYFGQIFILTPNHVELLLFILKNLFEFNSLFLLARTLPDVKTEYDFESKSNYLTLLCIFLMCLIILIASSI